MESPRRAFGLLSTHNLLGNNFPFFLSLDAMLVEMSMTSIFFFLMEIPCMVLWIIVFNATCLSVLWSQECVV